ncbi:MAG: DUF5103 domain-containing protein [Dysgonamonadaceae bacterium]|jgi:hypothetical protein|nr:DUF5103 domain-containing protein [Dysgonamonadaceae bacterium]
MRNTIAFLFYILVYITNYTVYAQTFRTETLSEAIRTLRVFPSGHWNLPPIIQLQQNESIEISFDLLGATPEYFTYRILHCDAGWTPSQLAQSEYLDGLQNYPVDDYAHSFNTTMDYVNYRLLIPNEQVHLKVSGNYVVQILSANGSQTVLTACFSVVEPQAGIQMQVSPVTDKGVNTKYQAVSFEVNYGNDIQSPIQDLKVYVLQNNRFDNEAKLVKPLNLQNKKALYDHSPTLIFEAGNEYRSFEMTTIHYAGLHIEAVEFYDPYYHTTLKPDALRSNRSYLFNEDINGRLFVRNNEAEDSDIEADYHFVHFYLPCNQPFQDNVYILSEAFNNILDTRSQIEYSAADNGYIKSVLLKEGYYNYLYVNRKNNTSPASAALVEGDYYQTENEYRVMVYARPIGWRYDKLIGVQTIQFK